MLVVDAKYRDGISWGPALRGNEAAARKLLKGFDKQVQAAVNALSFPARVLVPALMRPAVTALHRLLGSSFGSEIDELAEAIGVDASDIILANLAYDLVNLGCSTFVAPGPSGPLHARTLDWPFPGKLLKTHIMTTRVRGAPAGDYAMVGWPGFFGALTGVAPGRFSVTVNYVVHASESGVGPALQRARNGWPVPWAVRMALDDCKTFNSAVRFLNDVSLLSPVLFTLAGTKPGEAITIERAPDDSAHRRHGDGMAVTTNHYVCKKFKDANVDQDETSSLERFEQLEGILSRCATMTAADALRGLSTGWVNDTETQHRAVMSAADGFLQVQVPGKRAVTVDLG
jgi:hypothetical protein